MKQALNNLVRAGLFSIVAVCLAVAGCSRSGSDSSKTVSTAPAKPDPVDMSALTQSFEKADASTKLFCQEIMAAVRGKDFVGALSQFKMLEKSPKISTEQKQAVQDVIGKLEAMNRR